MKVTIREAGEFEAIPPRNVALYLEGAGWYLIDKKPDRFTIWEQPQHSVRVLVPASRSLGDYAIRLQQIVEALERVEGRSQLEIITDLSLPFTDVIRFRHVSEGYRSDSVTLDTGIGLVAQARSLILAAACAAVVPKAKYPTRKPEPAEDYIKHIRLGHTERGSFVITILSQISVSQTLFPDLPSEPFERRATRTLLDAVSAATEAALASQQQADLSAFAAAMNRGVSANLCDALIGLQEKTDAVALDLSVKWAFGRNLPKPEVPDYVRIPRKLLPAFADASHMLKQFSEADFPLEGPITHLHSEWSLQRHGPQPVGMVTVEAPMGKVRVTLPLDDYLRAVEAHKIGYLIKARGDIVKKGRYLQLLEPYDVRFEPY